MQIDCSFLKLEWALKLVVVIAVLVSTSPIYSPAGLAQFCPYGWRCREVNYGLLDKTGKLTALPDVVSCKPFDESGWAEVRVRVKSERGCLTKLMNPDGKVVPISDAAEIVGPMKDHRAPVRILPQGKGEVAPKNAPTYTYCTDGGDLLDARFQKVTPFSKGVAAVMVKNTCGFVGMSGALLPNQKLVACEFKGELAEGMLAAHVGKKWGYLDTHGSWIVKPTFDSAQAFHNGFAIVGVAKSPSSLDCVSFVDKCGKVFEKRFLDAKDFEGGCAAVVVFEKCGKDSGPRWGLIDREGNWVIKPRFLAMSPVVDHLRVVKDGDLSGIVDESGRWILKPNLVSIVSEMSHLSLLRAGDRTYLADKVGNIVVAPGGIIGPFSEGLACYSPADSGKFGFIDLNGKTIVAPQYKNVGDFSEGLAWFQSTDNHKYGYIDRSGKVVITPQFVWAWDFSEGLAQVELENGKKGFIDCSGSLVMSPQFKDTSRYEYRMSRFNNGVCSVALYDKPERFAGFGYIDRSGRWIGSRLFKSAYPFVRGHALVEY